MQLLPWNQRTIRFDRSVQEMPLLLERMAGTPARLAHLTRSLPREHLVLSREGKWSIMEHIAHLLHLDLRFQARVDDFVARRSELCRIDLDHHHREVNGHRDRTLGDLLEEFRLGRSVLVRRIRQMDDSVLGQRAMHPCQHRPMSAVDMALWIAEHDDHHLATGRIIAGPVLDDGAWC